MYGLGLPLPCAPPALLAPALRAPALLTWALHFVTKTV
jgi:hypothetical protein